MQIFNLWQELDGKETINTILDVASGRIYEFQPIADDQLFSSPFTLPRDRLGLAGRLAVPNASRVLISGHRSFCSTFAPGIHSLRGCPPGRLIGQLVDMSQHSLTIKLSNLRTADLAQITFETSIEFKVDNPWAVVQIKAPTQTLTRMLESYVRDTVEKLSHCSLLTALDSDQMVSRVALERQIRRSLHTETALRGLHILSVKIGKMEGVPQYLDLVAKKIVAGQQLLTEEAILQVRQQLASKERELAIFQAQTDHLVNLAKAESQLEDAKRQAAVFEQEATQRKVQREMEELRLDYELAKARIEALSQAIAPLSSPNHVVANATYAQPNYQNGRDQALAQVIDNLTAPKASHVSGSSNGQARK